MFILGGFLFSAIFYGVAFSIKKEVFRQNPVNTPQKNGDPLFHMLYIIYPIDYFGASAPFYSTLQFKALIF